jgi:DNA-nicking Smr family endonuclease
MSRRRKRRPKPAATPPDEPTSVLKLLSETAVATLDLHGRTTHQASLHLQNFLTTHSRISARSVVHIITGKSTAVLLELVRDMLDDEAAEHVDEYAGMMGGGGWVVRVR